ncbi:MAG: hypothetical protein IK066_00545, partial [Kiritimatiellae bacterium]|nr:hypothetical protein [Kiritimatiellia bacterium]
TRVIAVRTTGLWGSVWSRAGRTASPPFVPTLLKSAILWLFALPFLPRRRVTLHLEDLTAQTTAWAQSPRQDFNRHLEEWYMARSSDPRSLESLES